MKTLLDLLELLVNDCYIKEALQSSDCEDDKLNGCS